MVQLRQRTSVEIGDCRAAIPAIGRRNAGYRHFSRTSILFILSVALESQTLKLNILSDLHLGLGAFDRPVNDADVVILAGDISRPLEAVPGPCISTSRCSTF